MLGGTVYTFSIILAVFLIGLGIGSSVGSWLARGTTSPRVALGVLPAPAGGRDRLGRVSTGAVAALLADRSLAGQQPLAHFQLDLLRCAWAMLPAAVPVGRELSAGAGRGGRRRGQRPGRLVGDVYAANTVGAIVGAVGVQRLLIVRWLGTQYGQRAADR